MLKYQTFLVGNRSIQGELFPIPATKLSFKPCFMVWKQNIKAANLEFCYNTPKGNKNIYLISALSALAFNRSTSFLYVRFKPLDLAYLHGWISGLQTSIPDLPHYKLPRRKDLLESYSSGFTDSITFLKRSIS